MKTLYTLIIIIGFFSKSFAQIPFDQIKWKHYSSVNGDLPVPNEGGQQTAVLVLDIDKDGINDFVITERTSAPSVTWYKFNNYKWERYVVDAENQRI
jgi:hypothetical protein